jgi:LuxR family transcriptional regulator, maltose regulon positive regulatory protein
MASAASPPASGMGRHRAEGHGYGLVLLASVLLVIVGCFNLIYGIAATANSHVFTAHAVYAFGNLRAWGWITLIIAALQLLAAAGMLAGNQWARWFGMAVLGLNAIDQMFFILAYSFWSLTIIAVDVAALYGLCAYSGRRNLELHRRAYAWDLDQGITEEAIHRAFEAGAYAEAAELIEACWATYLNASRSASVLAWLRRFPDQILNGSVRLLLIEAWVLSLSARREDAARAIAAVERLGELAGGPLSDGFSSAEASLTLLRAVCPWGDVGAQVQNARRAADLEGPGSSWRPVVCWTVAMGLYFRGEFGEADRWFAESAAQAPKCGQWLAGASSLAYRSLIAGERGRLEEQRLLAERAMEVVRERGTEMANGAVPVALGVSLAARGNPEEAQPLIERGIAFMLPSRGEPTQVANALLHHASVLQTLGEGERSKAVIAEARSIIDSCSDPGILTERIGRLSPGGDPCDPRVKSLTPAELRILHQLATHHTLAQIAAKLYVSRTIVKTHVASIHSKLGVSTRAGAVAALGPNPGTVPADHAAS